MLKPIKSIHFLITGGTIGSEWSPSDDTAVVTAQNAVNSYFKDYISPPFEIKQTIVTMKDSREITDYTRHDISNEVIRSKAENIIITHGTYTMPDTARFLKKNLLDHKDCTNKRIILIGSFWPLKGYSPSDAPFNIGFAIGVIPYIDPGVYVAMHSTLFEAEMVTKDIEHAHFQSYRNDL